MADVSLRQIYKRFGDNEVIHGISCDIQDGEFVVILGPSGCGKSTVLRMIAGLEKISVGGIAIDGRVVNRLEPAERDIDMVFQNYALYPHMSVYKNMAYGLKIRKIAKTEIDRRVKATAGILGLTEFLDRKPRQLSGGQRQRVAMGRAIVREPKVFLFDEPLSNLDAKLRVQMRLELRNLHADLRVTSIYVTHDQVEAMTLGDRLIVMNNGYVEQIGTPLEVYEFPETLFVAGFIGSPAMNFIDAQLNASGLQLNDDLSIQFDRPLPTVADDREVVVGIRPEHLELDPAGSALFQLQVDHLEILGADTLVYGHLNDRQIDLTVRLPAIRHFDRGDRLPLSVSSKQLHIFRKSDGTRIDR